MGKKIDRLFLKITCIVGLYIFFAYTYENIPMALLWTFISCVLLKSVSGHVLHFWQGGRISSAKRAKKNAADQLILWALSNEQQAADEIRALIEKAYPEQIGAETRFFAILRHPQGAPFTQDDLLPLYKKSSDASQMLVASTAPIDPGTRAFAKALKNPKIALLEGAQLVSLLTRFSPAPAAEKAPRPKRARPILAGMIRREQSLRRALYGAGLLAMYLLIGNVLYLISALVLFLFAGLGLRKKPEPAALF